MKLFWFVIHLETCLLYFTNEISVTECQKSQAAQWVPAENEDICRDRSCSKSLRLWQIFCKMVVFSFLQSGASCWTFEGILRCGTSLQYLEISFACFAVFSISQYFWSWQWHEDSTEYQATSEYACGVELSGAYAEPVTLWMEFSSCLWI